MITTTNPRSPNAITVAGWRDQLGHLRTLRAYWVFRHALAPVEDYAAIVRRVDQLIAEYQYLLGETP